MFHIINFLCSKIILPIVVIFFSCVQFCFERKQKNFSSPRIRFDLVLINFRTFRKIKGQALSINLRNLRNYYKWFRSSHRRLIKVFLKLTQNSQENTCVRVTFLVTLKQTPTQVFFSEYFKIFRNSSFYRTLLVAASVLC